MRDMNERKKVQTGFSLIEVMITLAILLTVSAIVMSLSFSMTVNQASVANRSDMHASVRSVTSLLQQEITQAGRISFPLPLGSTAVGGAGVTTPVLPCPEYGLGVASPLTVADPAYLFDGIRLLVGAGHCQEIVAYNAGNGVFKWDHPAGDPVRPAGTFGEGILAVSDGDNLHMFGDINADGQMVYIRYTCTQGTLAAPGTLTRTRAAWNAVALDPPQILLRNVLCNNYDPDTQTCGVPVDAIPCFTYQLYDPDPAVAGTEPTPITVDGVTTNFFFTLNVGVTLTAKAEFNDMQTNAPQVETKALLNVSPRNIFEAWQFSQADPSASGTRKYIQPTPTEITTLSALPLP